jgi:hypothetical protein
MTYKRPLATRADSAAVSAAELQHKLIELAEQDVHPSFGLLQRGVDRLLPDKPRR